MTDAHPLPTPPRKVMMLGLDAASIDFWKKNADALPVFSKLLSDGAFKPLTTPASRMTASVWPTFCSGSLPGVHGQYFPFQWDAPAMNFRRVDKPVWASQFAYDPFWRKLGRDGLDYIVLDAAHVLECENATGLEVINWSYQSSGAAKTTDPAVLRELRQRFGRRPIGVEVPVPKSRAQCIAIRDSLIKSVRAKTDAILWLMQEKPWSFFLAGIYDIHRAGHNLWPVDGEFGSDAEKTALLAVCQEADKQLGRILETIDLDETLLTVFALHGMDANRAQDHFLDAILGRLNAAYLEQSQGGDSVSTARPPQGPAAPHPNAMAALRARVPFGIQYKAAQILGEDVQDWVVNRTLIGGADWSKTPAFRAQSGGEGLIRLNMKGRERDGFFNTPQEADAFIDWFTDEALKIKDVATGEPLVSDVRRLAEDFPGPRADKLPDLALVWRPSEPVQHIASPTIGEVQAKLATGRGGNHTNNAFAILYGAGAKTTDLSDVNGIEDLHRIAGRLRPRRQAAA